MRWVLPSICAALWLASCGPHMGTGREPDEYTGCATDEHWVTFDDQEKLAVTSDAQAAQVTAPTTGASLAQKPIVSWQRTPSEAGAPDGDVPHVNGPGCDNCCPQYNTGALTTLHLPAVSGNVYDLQFSIDGALTHRVLTTLQRWSPSDALWSSWKGKTLSLRIYRMTVLRNEAKEGPFTTTAALTFTAQ
jgi:hypothetical protein